MSVTTRVVATAATLLIATPAFAQPIAPSVQKRIDRILKRTPLIDGHNDLPEQLRENYKLSVEGLASGGAEREKPLMTDIARLRQGRVGGQFWSVWITGTYTGDEAIRMTIEQIDTVTRLVKAYPDDLELTFTARDMERAHKRGRIGSLIGVEGGRQMGGSLAALRQFYRLGARYMTLTHNQTTEWADSGTDEPKFDGLSPFGIEVVKEMNRLGMLVDLSHVSPATAADAIAASKAPVIFSHSDVSAINPHPRTVPDDVLRLLPENGGVVMITFVPAFLSSDFWAWSRERSAQETRLKSLYSYSKAKVEEGLKAWDAAHPKPDVPISVVADHIEHVVKIAGHDHVGLGGDFDGIDYTVPDLNGVEDYPNLFAELIRRGWSDKDLAKLAGGNILRVMKRAEAVASSMKDEQPSMATLEATKTE
jgi:membrane dipeptidase